MRSKVTERVYHQTEGLSPPETFLNSMACRREDVCHEFVLCVLTSPHSGPATTHDKNLLSLSRWWIWKSRDKASASLHILGSMTLFPRTVASQNRPFLFVCLFVCFVPTGTFWSFGTLVMDE